MFAGANGSGKSTLFSLWKTKGMHFINADELKKIFHAAPAPELLAQKMSDILREHYLSQAVSFATETVFSDPVGAKLAYLRNAQKNGYRVCLIYVVLASSQLSSLRVQGRVQNGGHSVPQDKLPRRYMKSMENAAEALKFVDFGIVFDNSYGLDSQHPVKRAFQLTAVTQFGKVSYVADDPPTYVQSILPKPLSTEAQSRAKK